MSASLERRQFFKIAALLSGGMPALAAAAIPPGAAPARGLPEPALSDDVPPSDALRWLDGAPASFQGATWGVPWPQGRVPKDSGFELRNAAGGPATPVQSWPLAYWPDGTLKWSAHALAPEAGTGAGAGAPVPAAGYQLQPLALTTEAGPPLARISAGAIEIDTGALQCTLPTSGALLIATMKRAGKPLLRDGRLVLLVDVGQGAADDETAGAPRRAYDSAIDKVTLEQAGPLRAVVRIDGAHRHADGARLLPFVLRLYFYKNAGTLRLVHTLVYDADPAQAFVRGVGLRFGVPLAGPLHDRHVRFAGAERDDKTGDKAVDKAAIEAGAGIFAEAVRGLTGLRRDPGADAVAAQLAGRAVGSMSAQVEKGLRYIPAFGSYTLLQSHPDGFSIAKRTGAGSGWIHAASGTRASGTGYLGTPAGGVAFGVRNFWQSYPGQIDIAGAESELAQVTLWLWAPQAPGMDLRFYHNGLGEDSFAKQRDALDITYEDYEPGYGSPYGVARTSELELQLLAATPSAAQLLAISRRIAQPPQLVAPSSRMHAARVFSDYWHPAPLNPLPAAATLEKQLAWSFDFYRGQVEQRKWYGFWDYGDVMHTYDAQRHVWRYDVGGYAWDNSELSTEIWLWHYFLHSGRADAFRMAQAMTRHTGEVDVHHIGPFSPLGSRHAVQHWGDSGKQLRVSTVINRRFMYYLTADERIGDLLSEQVDAVARLRQVVPGRKIGQHAAQDDDHASVAFGTDWGAVAAAWFAEWERSGQPRYRDKLLASMASIAAHPHGFIDGGGVMDLRTGAFAIDANAKPNVSHLSAVFGLAEICSELIRTVPQLAFRDAWLQYCRLYSATPAQQQAALGHDLGKLNLSQGHARLLAYAAVQGQDRAMLARAWAQFFQGKAGLREQDLVSRRVAPPLVLTAVDEAPAVSTNAMAQWGLGAMGMLALDAQSPLLFGDNFARFDARAWAVEAEAGDAPTAAFAESGALVLDAARGLTVWLRTQLIGHYEIAFTRTVLAEGKPHERLSDLNFFWEAQLGDAITAPAGLFARSGKLEEYDKVPMFYAGIGGNTNTTSRFRYYDGTGARKLLQEYLAPDYLLKANVPYRIRIVVDAKGTRLFVDDRQYFEAAGPLAGGGYFGLRTTQSRQKVEHFTVRRVA